MARYDYGHETFDIDKIIGFLFRNGWEDEARTLVQDSRSPSDSSLLQYDSKKTIMKFTGLEALQKGDTSPLKEGAESNPKVVRTLLTFGHVCNGDLYSTALSSHNGVTPTHVIGDVIEAMGKVFPDPSLVLRMVIGGVFKHEQNAKLLNADTFKAVHEGVKKLAAAPEDRNTYQVIAQNFVLTRLMAPENYSGTKHGMKAEEVGTVFGLARDVLGDAEPEKANAFIRQALQGDVIALTATSRGDDEVVALNLLFDEAHKAGMADADLAATLTQADELGRSLFDKVAAHGKPEVFTFLTDKLREFAGQEPANAFIKSWLGKKRGAFNDDASSQLQYVEDRQGQRPQAINKITFGSAELAENMALRQHIQQKVVPVVNDWIACNPVDQNDSYKVAQRKLLQDFADSAGPVVEGPTIIPFIGRNDMLATLLRLKAEVDGLNQSQLADAFYDDMSKPVSLKKGGQTAMNENWAYSARPPRGEGDVREGLSDFVAILDDVFGTEIAVPLLGRLLALKDGEDKTSLEQTLYDGPQGDYAKYCYPVIVKNVASVLGDDAKFKRYMDEAIMPNMPVSFGGGGGKGTASSVHQYLSGLSATP